MTQTEWTEEKLRKELENIVDDWQYGARITSSLVTRIHELYKKATYLKGNKELPPNPFEYYPSIPNPLGTGTLQISEIYPEAQQDMVNDGFKSTEEWDE